MAYAFGTTITYIGPVAEVYSAICATNLKLHSFKLVYRSSANGMGLADKDSESTLPAIGMVVSGATYNALGLFVQRGWIRNSAWTWATAGKLLYTGDSGVVTTTPSTATGDFNQVVGQTLGTYTILLSPQLTWDEVT